MKKKILLIFSIFFIVLFFIVQTFKENRKVFKYKILKVVSADEFYLDLNFNNKIDDNEKVFLDNVVAFRSQKGKYTDFWAKVLEISVHDYLKNGSLADNWAKDNLENKTFSVFGANKCKITGYECKVSIDFNGVDLSSFLLMNGLAHYPYVFSDKSYMAFFSLNQIKKNIELLKNFEFLVVNTNNGIVHDSNCKYVKTIQNPKYILKKYENFDVTCKLCKNNRKFQKYVLPSKNKYPKSVYKKFDDIEIYLINPLEYSKPNEECNTQICKRIVKEIDNTKEQIDLAFYGIGNQKDIINALRKAKLRGVKIRSVVDYSANMNNIYPLTSSFVKEFDSVLDKTEILMHNKFFIFDNKLLITGSANLSATGFGGYNANNVIVTKNKNVIDRYIFEFSQMYNGKFSKEKEKCNLAQDEKVQAYFSPKDDIYNSQIKPRLQQARKRIYVSSFYLTDYDMLQELINAKKRGLEVVIISDALSAQSFKKRFDKLRKNKIWVLVENWGGKNHEKTILIDDNELILGSCNFSKSGFYKNDENVLIIKNHELASLYLDYFSYLFNSIDKTHLFDYPRAESIESINSCFDGIDNDFDSKTDNLDEGCAKK